MGWFSKKKKAPAEAPPPQEPASSEQQPAGNGEQQSPANSEAVALIRRWDETIAELRAGFDAILAEATAGSEPLIEATELDLTPLTLPWNTIEAKRHQVGEEVGDKWDEISDEMSDCDAFTHEMMMSEGSKRDAAIVEIELSYLWVYGGVMARAAEKMRQVALSADASDHQCQACGGPLDNVRPVAEALNVECGHCDAMNTVEPGNALRMFSAMGALPLAEQAAFAHRATMMRAENQMHQYRESKDVPLALLQQFEQAALQYYTTRLNVEASYHPELARHIEAKLARHTKDTHKTLKQYVQWRQHQAS